MCRKHCDNAPNEYTSSWICPVFQLNCFSALGQLSLGCCKEVCLNIFPDCINIMPIHGFLYFGKLFFFYICVFISGFWLVLSADLIHSLFKSLTAMGMVEEDFLWEARTWAKMSWHVRRMFLILGSLEGWVKE